MNKFVSILVAIAMIAGVGCAASRSGDGAPLERDEINTAKVAAHANNEAGDFRATVELLQPLLDRSAAANQRIIDSQVYSLLATSYWKLGAYDQAMPNFEQALRLDYGSAEDHLKLAEMLMEMNKVGRALTEFELAVKYGVNDPLALYNYGLALYQFGRQDDALAQWNMAHSLDRGNPQYVEALGIGYSGRDDESSLKYFEMAKELGSDSALFHNNFGVLLQRLVRYTEAAVEFREAASLDPANTAYRSNLAAAYLAGGDAGQAIPLLTELHREEPGQRRHVIYLAKALYTEGHFADAIALLDPWIDTQSTRRQKGEPGLSEAFDTLAMSYRELGDLGKALSRIEKAVAAEGDNPVYLNNYGVILAENGRIEEAKIQWEKVLQLDPDNAAAKQNLSTFAR